MDDALVQRFLTVGFVLERTFPADVARTRADLLWQETGCDLRRHEHVDQARALVFDGQLGEDLTAEGDIW